MESVWADKSSIVIVIQIRGKVIIKAKLSSTMTDYISLFISIKYYMVELKRSRISYQNEQKRIGLNDLKGINLTNNKAELVSSLEDTSSWFPIIKNCMCWKVKDHDGGSGGLSLKNIKDMLGSSPEDYASYLILRAAKTNFIPT